MVTKYCISLSFHKDYSVDCNLCCLFSDLFVFLNLFSDLCHVEEFPFVTDLCMCIHYANVQSECTKNENRAQFVDCTYFSLFLIC